MLQEVKVFEKDTFAEEAQKQPLMIKFYADYCGHCKKLAPIYEDLSNSVENITFGKIECPSHRIICGRYDIKGFPTLILFKDGQKYQYEGPRNKQNMINWLQLFDKPLFIRDQQQNLTELAEKFYFDHYYNLKLQNCDQVETELQDLKGQAIIQCQQISNEDQKEQIQITFFKTNLTYQFQKDTNESFTTYQIQRLVYYYNEELFSKVNTQNFQQCIKLGGMLFTYTKNSNQTKEIERVMKELANKQDLDIHYGMMYHTGRYSERIINTQLHLDLNQNQLIYFNTRSSPFKLYSMELDLDANFTDQYEKFKNNLEEYEKPYDPIVRQQKKHNNQLEPRTILMILALTLIIIIVTSICICDYTERKHQEQQRIIIEKSVKESEQRKKEALQKLLECQKHDEEENEEEELVSLNQIDEECKQ